MQEALASLHLTLPWWVLACLGSFLLGVAKGGVKGIGTIITTIMALSFGSKASTGILMPLLLTGDVFAVLYYHRHAQWRYLRLLMPWIIGGVLIGVWYGKDLPEQSFKRGMAALILASVALMWWLDKVKQQGIPDSRPFAAVMGTISGFTTMVGNLAGPFSELYFLAIRTPKAQFIGTSAWIFFLTNVFKLPFHILAWKTIHVQTLYVDLVLLLPLLLGLWAGVHLVSRTRQNEFRSTVMILTVLGAILIFLR